jgi:chemotaxis protein CheD
MVTVTKNNLGADFLLPVGDVYFGKSPGVIKTLLGSCVAVTVWNETYQVGGMCHYLLATTNNPLESNNYRYGMYALDYLYQNMIKYSPANEFELRLFGGGKIYPTKQALTIGESNVAFAKQWLNTHDLNLAKEDVLGSICRTIIFNLSNGLVTMQRYKTIEEND